MLTKDRFSLSAWVEESIRDFAKSPANNLGGTHDEPAFDVPLVGFSSGDDPLYVEFKTLDRPFSLDTDGSIYPGLSRCLDYTRAAHRHHLDTASDTGDESRQQEGNGQRLRTLVPVKEVWGRVQRKAPGLPGLQAE